MTRKFKVRGFLGSLATLTAILGVTAPANAITFNYVTSDAPDTTNNVTEITKTVDGLTLTLDDPRAYDRTTTAPFEATNTNPAPNESETGLKLSSNTSASPLPYQFQLTFDKAVRLVSYEVTNTESDGVGDYFNLTQGSVESLNNRLENLGTVNFRNQSSVFQANTPILFVSGDILEDDPDAEPNDEMFFLDNIQVELASSSAAVPFEFSPTLGLLAVGGIWGMSRLRKKVTAKKVMDELSA